MATRRNALGRGLDALISTPSGAEAPAADARPAGAPTRIPVERIVPNPRQPRRHFDEERLQRLADSIRSQGMIEPVVVREAGERYELVVGERRWRASRLAGLETVPALIKDLAPRESLELALVENVQREDLNPIELALAFQALAEGGLSQEAIGRRVSLERSTVSNHLRLLELPREIQEDVEGGRLSMGHAKALLQVPSPERRRHVRDRIVERGMSVRESEELARRAAGPARRRATRPRAGADPDLEPVVDALRDSLKTRVRIRGSSARGRIEIEFFGPDDLDRIVRLLQGQGAQPSWPE